MNYNKSRFDEVTINYDKKRIPISYEKKKKRQGNYRYYGAQGVIDYVDDYIFDGKYLLIAEDGENLKSKKENIAQLVEGKFWVNNHAHVVQANERCDLNFLFYLINSMDLSGYITGSVQPKLSQANLNSLELIIPEMEIQRKIVRVIGAIDEKIHNNNKINKNLQEQMEALHRSWFIDYAPFGGVKPSNWIKANIYSIANIIYGAPFASKLFNTEGLGKPIIRIRDLKEQAFVTYTTEIHPKGHLIQPGDIVVGMDGEFRPYIWGNSEAWLNQRVCIFESKLPSDKAFMLYTIKPLLNVIEQTQVATTVIHIGKKDYDAFEIVLPDRKTLDQFGEITTPMLERIVNNSIENKKLAKLRDALLPQLMSGEIDVSDVAL